MIYNWLITNLFSVHRWIGGIAGCLCLILYLPGIFTEKYIAAKELDYKKTHKEAKEGEAAAKETEAANAAAKVKHRLKQIIFISNLLDLN